MASHESVDPLLVAPRSDGMKPLCSSGFTLIELLIAMVIIAALSGLGFAGYSAVVKRARIDGTRTVVLAVSTAIQRHDRQDLAVPVLTGANWRTIVRRAWDLDDDNVLDGDPSLDPKEPLNPAVDEFTAAEKAEATSAAYRGLVAESPNLSLPPRHVDAGKHVLDAWRKPLRIDHGDSERFSGSRFGVWSTGPNGVDESGDGDDIASWKSQ